MRTIRTLFALLALCIAFYACSKENTIELPPHLFGTWEVKHIVERFNMGTLVSSDSFEFQLQLNKDGTGLYGFPSVGIFVNVFWSTSFDFSKVFITIENTFDPQEKILLNYVFDVLEDEDQHQLWSLITKRGVEPNISTEFWHWELNKS
jgi:hypothetical protein